MPQDAQALPTIPVIDVGPEFPLETFDADPARAHKLVDGATAGVPRFVLRGLDRISRHWLAKHGHTGLPEIDKLAARLGRPGALFLSVNYEWGCTVAVGPSPDGAGARHLRTLDWFIPGLGRYVMAARVAGRAGPFVTMTWPGFTGVLQAMAPGRFSVALNQAPLARRAGGLFATDWLAARARVWRMPHPTPLYFLRSVLDTARDYREARQMLRDMPIAAPATYSLAGIRPDETCVIERSETRAHVIDGPACAANHWQGLDHGARSRGLDSVGRYAAICRLGAIDLDPAMPWLRPPVLNHLTRVAMVADASEGRLIAQGFEDGLPATQVLVI